MEPIVFNPVSFSELRDNKCYLVRLKESDGNPLVFATCRLDKYTVKFEYENGFKLNGCEVLCAYLADCYL